MNSNFVANWMLFYSKFGSQLKYAKNYRNETEEKMRMGIFLENKHKIDEHNERHANGSVTFKMSLNKYSDLTSDEFSTQMGLVSVA